MLLQEVEIAPEVGPVYWVIPNAVHVAMEPHPVDIQGGQGFSGVERCLAVQWNFRDITRAALLDLAPLLRGAPEVPRLLGPLEGPVLDFPKPMLALGLPQRYETPLEGVSHRHTVLKHALGGRG